MSISAYIKEIGRGKHGARGLPRDQAQDLMGQILDQRVSDLELGAFCLAMRIKGETPEEMAGFLDAIHVRLNKLPAGRDPVVVLPSYNGARKMPVLTPLLALLLAQQGLAVVVHAQQTESSRVSALEVFKHLGVAAHGQVVPARAGQVTLLHTSALHPMLDRLLSVRQVVGLRNSGHSLVKLLKPVDGPALLVTSYTHPEYLLSMTETLRLTGMHALLLRATEGEPVAHPHRAPAIDLLLDGVQTRLQEKTEGPLTQLAELPDTDAASTAHFTQNVLNGSQAAPQSLLDLVRLITQQVQTRS